MRERATAAGPGGGRGTTPAQRIKYGIILFVKGQVYAGVFSVFLYAMVPVIAVLFFLSNKANTHTQTKTEPTTITFSVLLPEGRHPPFLPLSSLAVVKSTHERTSTARRTMRGRGGDEADLVGSATLEM